MVGRITLLGFLLMLVMLGLACGDGAAPPPSASPAPGQPTATPFVTPSPTVTLSPVADGLPDVINGVEVVPLEVGDEAELPEDVALIVETGCWQCDGPTTGFLRVYRDPSGQIRTETLLSVETLALPPRLVTTSKGVEEMEPYITGFAINDDASEIVVSVCIRESCGSGGLDAWSPDADTALFRSTDGGVTWRKFGELGRGGSVLGLVREDVVLVSSYEAELAPPTFSLFPTGNPAQPPNLAPHEWPLLIIDGDIIWQSRDGKLVRSDGSDFLDLGAGAYAYARSVATDSQDTRLMLSWSRDEGSNPPTGPPEYFLSSLATDGQLLETFSAPGFLLSGASLRPGLLVGNTDVTPEQLTAPAPQSFLGILPALIDLDAGLVHPITDPFLAPDFRGGRNLIQAAIHGPFARVIGTGSCVRIRAEPGLSAQVLDCVADGVLLRHTGETREADGTSWLRVVTPAGVEGWSSTAYLER